LSVEAYVEDGFSNTVKMMKPIWRDLWMTCRKVSQCHQIESSNSRLYKTQSNFLSQATSEVFLPTQDVIILKMLMSSVKP
jgi:hypothetical protein